MTERRQNPIRLVVWAFAGSLLVSGVFFLTFLPISRLHETGSGPWAELRAGGLRMLVVGLPFVAGMAIWWRSQTLFTRGFVNGVWSEEKLAFVRALVERPFWRWIGLGWYLLGFAFMALAPHGFRHGAFLYSLVFPFYVVKQVRQLLAPRVVERGGLRDWRNFKPLHSSYWGQSAREDVLSK